jgi:hypothetical protein
MNEKQLRELFEAFCKTAEALFKQDGYVMSVVFVFGENGDMAFVPMVGNKNDVQASVRMTIVKLNAAALIFSGETYVVSVPKGGPLPVGEVRNDPRCVEQVIVTLESRALNMMRAWDIVSSDVAKRYLVPKQQVECPDQVASRWSGDWFRRCEGRR